MDDLELRILAIKVSVIVAIFLWLFPSIMPRALYYSVGAKSPVVGGLAAAITIVVYLYIQIKNIGKKK